MLYRDYIKSQAWQRKRREYYSSNLYKTLKGEGKWNCYCCGCNNRPLDLHHRTYKRLGNENISVDLIPVCRKCHSEIHEREKSGTQLWTATKKIRSKYLGKITKDAKKYKKREIARNRAEKKMKKVKKVVDNASTCVII